MPAHFWCSATFFPFDGWSGSWDFAIGMGKGIAFDSEFCGRVEEIEAIIVVVLLLFAPSVWSFMMSDWPLALGAIFHVAFLGLQRSVFFAFLSTPSDWGYSAYGGCVLV